MPTFIYHITHINNLESIVKADGLLACNAMYEAEAEYTNIAYESIQYRRATTRVPCSAGGVLHDYVPFYFAPRSPMLYAISMGNVEGYSEGQTPIIYLVSEAEKIADSNLHFAFTDGHPIINFTDFFDNLDYLNEAIDWEVMNARYWYDTDEHPDRKRKRQAEFLVYNFFPWQLVTEIGVKNYQIKTEVDKILEKNTTHQPPVKTRTAWYY
ncbi:type II toxin-antitoxin system toxin DNA ADP-ribosyl transferase DarT [Phormidium nigroviride]